MQYFTELQYAENLQRSRDDACRMYNMSSKSTGSVVLLEVRPLLIVDIELLKIFLPISRFLRQTQKITKIKTSFGVELLNLNW